MDDNTLKWAIKDLMSHLITKSQTCTLMLRSSFGKLLSSDTSKGLNCWGECKAQQSLCHGVSRGLSFLTAQELTSVQLQTIFSLECLSSLKWPFYKTDGGVRIPVGLSPIYSYQLLQGNQTALLWSRKGMLHSPAHSEKSSSVEQRPYQCCCVGEEGRGWGEITGVWELNLRALKEKNRFANQHEKRHTKL